MTRTNSSIRFASFLSAVILTAPGGAQEVSTILRIDYENGVTYVDDVADPAKLAKTAGPVQAARPTNFYDAVASFDITAVNGQPVKGLVHYSIRHVWHSRNLTTVRLTPPAPRTSPLDAESYARLCLAAI